MNEFFYADDDGRMNNFLVMPKDIIYGADYKDLSAMAKFAYCLLLDRVSLSVRNGFIDAAKRVYIFYKQTDLMETLACSASKVGRIIKELINFGLIEKKRTGLGKADKIYVKKIVAENTLKKESQAESKAIKSFENEKSRLVKKTNLDLSKSALINTDNNKTINNNTESYQINQEEYSTKKDETDENLCENYRELVADNIELETFDDENPEIVAKVNEVYETICDVVTVPRKTVRIQKMDYPYEVVKSRFLKLKAVHIDQVIHAISHYPGKIYNMKSFLLTTLYNSAGSGQFSYDNRVQNTAFGA